MSDSRPHIILFTTDQHRGDHLSIAGQPCVDTPSADAFVNRGAYFPNAYTEIPSTTGARRCMLGGQGSHTCGLVGYSSAEWHEPNTVAQVLADVGYHCIDVGWRNLHPRRKLYGFHTVIPHDLHEGADDYWDWLRRELGPQALERGHGCDCNGWQGRPWHLPERYHPTVWTNDVALEQIAKRDPTRPMFLWVSHLRPHSPYDPPPHFWDTFIDRKLPDVPVGDWAGEYEKPRVLPDRTAWCGRLTPERLQRMRAGYMATVTHLDWELGRFLEHVDRVNQGPERILDNALILFTADHGDMQGDHHLMRKCYAYEGSARIPMLVRYPRGLDLPCGTFEQPVGLQDVMPTILEAAGVDVPTSVEGRSLLAAARGEPWREFLHGEHSPCYRAQEAMHYLTDGREKYIWFPVTDQEQFFDLTADRQELHDLSASSEHADRVAAWRQRLIDRLADRPDGFSDGRRLIPKPDGWGPLAEG